MKRIFICLISILSCFVCINTLHAKDEFIKTETKNKVMFIKDNKGKFNYSWSFDKDNYKDEDFSFDMKITNKTLYKNEIDNIINKSMKKEFVSFNYHGSLPSKATIKIKTSKFKDGDRLNLYYYNDETNEIEKIEDNIMVMDGYVSFDINHCSDYFLSLSIVKEASGEKNSNGIIIIGMICVIVALVGYTIFKNKD